jgi:hypothetical protein
MLRRSKLFPTILSNPLRENPIRAPNTPSNKKATLGGFFI